MVITLPTVLFFRVGPRQLALGSLDREADLVQQLAHVARMVADAELLLDQSRDHWGRPDAGKEAAGDGATVDDICQGLFLRHRDCS